MGKDGQMGNVGNDWARLRAERMDTDGGGTVGAMWANTGKTGNVWANFLSVGNGIATNSARLNGTIVRATTGNYPLGAEPILPNIPKG